MDDEEGFLGMINENMDDLAPRLVYADWLEERGDIRSDLIRIEEEMKQLPILSDRYWELKPQRNLLRLQTSEEWLEAMDYVTINREDILKEIPERLEDRWRLIREHIERCYNLPLNDIGGRAEEIAELENRLGRVLPKSIREWVAFHLDLQSHPRHTQIAFPRDIYWMKELDGYPVVSILMQGEADYHWAVLHTDFQLEDPPIYGYYLDYENEDGRFISESNTPIFDSVSLFMINYALNYVW